MDWNEGINNTDKQANIQIIEPQYNADILPNRFEKKLHTCNPASALSWNGMGIHFAYFEGMYKTCST